MTPEVTIGLPFFNNAHTVELAVRSVFAQTFQDWRLILIDDGSTDDSFARLASIDDSRVELISDGANLGLATRLNQVTERTESALLARMDADDVMHPTRLERQVDAMYSEASPSLVFTDAVSIDATGRPTGYRQSARDPSASSYFRNSPYIHPTLLGRTDWFRCHPYDPSYMRCQDQELWVRTMGQQTTVAIEEPLLYLREAGTISSSKYATSMAGTRRVLGEHGPHILGQMRTQLLVTQTYVKQSVYMIAERLGQTDALVRTRATSLASGQESHHGAVLATIQATPVPGFE